MTVQRIDPYAVLGLTPSATQGEVRRAYRALLRQHHPDTQPLGDPAAQDASTASLRQVLAAYATLRDPTLRDPAGRARDERPTTTPRSAEHREAHRRTPPGQVWPEEPPIKAGPVRWHRSPQ